ncbi:MAG: hypothetical protein JXR45_16085 [Deltaproteobacteria bacterium]|nr:hypothetical protein [Deltaproteobacteria bacterium]
MPRYWIQISPEVKSAYFADYIEVAQQEWMYVFPNVEPEIRHIGPLVFFDVNHEHINSTDIMRLSFAQGIFEMPVEKERDGLRPCDTSADFRLHEDFVFGSKFKGKTNERLTQMLLNLGLSTIGTSGDENVKVLDPMCGRATTLLWALRYGISAKGLEQDRKSIEDVHRMLKKWSKIHKQKHQLNEGHVGGGMKKKDGRFLEFRTNDTSLKLVTGDARSADAIFRQEKFDLIISDLPYGVQHTTRDKTKNPMAVLRECASPWKRCLKENGAMVLAFNRNNPKRDDLVDIFENEKLTALPFSAPHRMSESIVRDVVIFTPATT